MGPTWVTPDTLPSQGQLLSNSICNLSPLCPVTQHVHTFRDEDVDLLGREAIILPTTEGNGFFPAAFKIVFGLTAIFKVFSFPISVSLSTSPGRSFVMFTFSSRSPLSVCLFLTWFMWEGNQENPGLHDAPGTSRCGV